MRNTSISYLETKDLKRQNVLWFFSKLLEFHNSNRSQTFQYIVSLSLIIYLYILNSFKSIISKQYIKKNVDLDVWTFKSAMTKTHA